MDKFEYFQGKKDDKWSTLAALSLITIFFIWRAIIDSGHLLFYFWCLILWIIVYKYFEYVQKKRLNKPASLWKVYKKKYPIIVQYAPPKWINPAEAWLLYNCSVEPTDLTSLIYQWKFENLIDIKTYNWENTKREYVKLVKKDDMPITRPLFESEIFESIFRMWDVKIIEWPFQLRYALMLEDLETHWIRKWWVTKFSWWKNFDKLYELLVGVFIVIVSLLTSWEVMIYIPILVVSFVLFLCCVIFWWYVYWWWKLKYTDKWAELASQVIWYSQFIKSCDEAKIKFFLKEDPMFIDRTLPYATAFWMETEFLKKISPLKNDWNAKYYKWKKIPSWVWILRFFRNEDSLF